MQSQYLLQHISKDPGGGKVCRLIGIFPTKELAEYQIAVLKDVKGFCEYSVKCFAVEPCFTSEDNWASGFVDIGAALPNTPVSPIATVEHTAPASIAPPANDVIDPRIASYISGFAASRQLTMSDIQVTADAKGLYFTAHKLSKINLADYPHHIINCGHKYIIDKYAVVSFTNITFDLTQKPLQIGSNITTLIFEKCTLDGGNRDGRSLRIAANEIKLTKVRFVNFAASPITVNNKREGSLIINKCVFKNCYSLHNTLFHTPDQIQDITITDCDFFMCGAVTDKYDMHSILYHDIYFSEANNFTDCFYIDNDLQPVLMTSRNNYITGREPKVIEPQRNLVDFVANYYTNVYQNTCTDKCFFYEDKITHKKPITFNDRSYRVLATKFFLAYINNQYRIYAEICAEVIDQHYHHSSTEEIRIYQRYGFDTGIKNPADLLNRAFDLDQANNVDAGRICGDQGFDVATSQIEIQSITPDNGGLVSFTWAGECDFGLHYSDIDSCAITRITFNAEVKAMLDWRSEVPPDFANFFRTMPPPKAADKTTPFLFNGFSYTVDNCNFVIRSTDSALHLYPEINASFDDPDDELDSAVLRLRLYNENGFSVAVTDVRELKGKKFIWDNEVNSRNEEAGTLYIIDHEAVTTAVLEIHDANDRTITFSWQGEADVYWNDDFADDVPFAVKITTNLVFK